MTPPEGDADALGRAFRTFSGELPIGGCPEPTAIWQAVRGESSADETRAIVLHTAACASCAEAWRIAHAAATDVPVTPVRESAWRSVWVWGPGLAAAALLVLSVLNNSAFSLPGLRPSPQLRERPAPIVSALVREDQPLDRTNFVLEWTPGPAGARYNVRVTTEDLSVVARVSGIDASRYQIPASSLTALPSGAKLLWQVDVVARDQPVRTSPTFVVRVR